MHAHPYHRHSKLKGTFERDWFRPICKSFHNRVLALMHKMAKDTRLPGQRTGALGDIALAVARVLLKNMNLETGCMDVAITAMMKELKRCRDAIVTALRQLCDSGWLERQRRKELRTDEDGPSIKQASNAYRFNLPDEFFNAPVADDLQDHEEQRAKTIETCQTEETAIEECEAVAKSKERVALHVANRERNQQAVPVRPPVEDTALNFHAARILARFKRRESAEQTES